MNYYRQVARLIHSERQTIKNYESETCTFLATFNQKYQMALLNIK